MSRRRVDRAAARERLRLLPGKGRRFAHLRQAAIFYIILGLLGLLILQAAYHWIGPHFLARRLQIVTAKVGTLERKLEVEGLITRQEQLLAAPCTGVIVELAPPGERAPAGSAAAVIAPLTAEEREQLEKQAGPAESLWERLKRYLSRFISGTGEGGSGGAFLVTGALPPWSAESVTLPLPGAGFLLHSLDGWEDSGERVYLSAEQYAETPEELFEVKEGLWVEKGQPLMKLVDNWQWNYNLLLPLDPGRTLAARDSVIFRFAFAPERPVNALLVAAEIDSEAEEVRLSYCIREQFPGFEDLRWSGAELLLESNEGVLIPATALVEREGERGVYLNRAGAVKFQPLEVIAEEGEQLAVEGLEPDSMVITRPAFVEEGQRLD